MSSFKFCTTSRTVMLLMGVVAMLLAARFSPTCGQEQQSRRWMLKDSRLRASTGSRGHTRMERVLTGGRISPDQCGLDRACSGGKKCCYSRCTDAARDAANCGRCGHHCALGRSCCNGVCTNLMTDHHNCGGCGRRCASYTKCDRGMCGYSS